MPEIMRHLAMALSAYVRRLHHEGFVVPPGVEELTWYLMQLASTRQGPPSSATGDEVRHDGRVRDRLLVTKAEAAERLGVSVRTIERLAATGRLPQVHVERSARFRVTDLESFVDGLSETRGDGLDESDNPAHKGAAAAKGRSERSGSLHVQE